jgi:hypothetical protein
MNITFNEEYPDEFFDRIYREQEAADLKFLEYMIEQDRLKHRFDKLKSPKPKWIHS